MICIFAFTSCVHCIQPNAEKYFHFFQHLAFTLSSDLDRTEMVLLAGSVPGGNKSA